jgi:predicted phosphodiesterase
MKVGIIADIHGNIHALKAVESALIRENVEEVWCLGDTIGYGAFPNECLEWVKGNVRRFVVGNHELAALGFVDLSLLNDYARVAIEWTREVLREDFREFLLQTKIQDLTDEFQLVHDTPESPGSMEYILSKAQAYRALIKQQRDVCFFAHTHVPAAYSLAGGDVVEIDVSSSFTVDGRVLINPGSVGQPRNRDPRSSFIVYEDGYVRYLKVEYDAKAAAKAILKAGLPDFLAARLILGV